MRKTTVWPLCSVFRRIKNPHSISIRISQGTFISSVIPIGQGSVRGEDFEKKPLKIAKQKNEKGNTSNMAKQIKTKIWPLICIIMLNTFTRVRIWLNLTVLEIYAKSYSLTLCSIFNNGGHVFRRIKKTHPHQFYASSVSWCCMRAFNNKRIVHTLNHEGR